MTEPLEIQVKIEGVDAAKADLAKVAASEVAVGTSGKEGFSQVENSANDALAAVSKVAEATEATQRTLSKTDSKFLDKIYSDIEKVNGSFDSMANEIDRLQGNIGALDRVGLKHDEVNEKTKNHKESLISLPDLYANLEQGAMNWVSGFAGFAAIVQLAREYLSHLEGINEMMKRLTEQSLGSSSKAFNLANQFGDTSDQGLKKAQGVAMEIGKAGGLDEDSSYDLASAIDTALGDKGGVRGNMDASKEMAAIFGTLGLKGDAAASMLQMLVRSNSLSSPEKMKESVAKIQAAFTKAADDDFSVYATGLAKGATTMLSQKGGTLDDALQLFAEMRGVTDTADEAGQAMRQTTRAAMGMGGKMGELLTNEAKKRGKDYVKMDMGQQIALLKEVVRDTQKAESSSNREQIEAENKRISDETDAQIKSYQEQQRKLVTDKETVGNSIEAVRKTTGEKLKELDAKLRNSERAREQELQTLEDSDPKSMLERKAKADRLKELRRQARDESNRYEDEKQAIQDATDTKITALQNQQDTLDKTQTDLENKIRITKENASKRIEANKAKIAATGIEALKEAIPAEIITRILPGFSEQNINVQSETGKAVAAAKPEEIESRVIGYTGSEYFRNKRAQLEAKQKENESVDTVDVASDSLRRIAEAEYNVELKSGKIGVFDDVSKTNWINQRMWEIAKKTIAEKDKEAQASGDVQAQMRLSQIERQMGGRGFDWGGVAAFTPDKVREMGTAYQQAQNITINNYYGQTGGTSVSVTPNQKSKGPSNAGVSDQAASSGGGR